MSAGGGGSGTARVKRERETAARYAPLMQGRRLRPRIWSTDHPERAEAVRPLSTVFPIVSVPENVRPHPFSSLLPPCPFVPTRALLPPSLYPPPPPSLFRHPSRLSHIGCRRERTRCKTRIALIARPRAMQKSLRDEMTNVILEDRGDDYLDGNLSSQSIAEDVRESGVRRVDCLLA